MSQILVRNLSPETVELLKKRARENKRSLEAEVREILDDAAIEGSSPEFKAYLRDLATGRNRKAAFIEYSDRVLAKRPFEATNSAEEIREERDEREARLA
jgi:plasmid stability protein